MVEQQNKSWIGNHLSQAEIVCWLGLSLWVAVKTNNSYFIIAMITSMFVGILIRGNTPQ